MGEKNKERHKFSKDILKTPINDNYVSQCLSWNYEYYMRPHVVMETRCVVMLPQANVTFKTLSGVSGLVVEGGGQRRGGGRQRKLRLFT